MSQKSIHNTRRKKKKNRAMMAIKASQKQNKYVLKPPISSLDLSIKDSDFANLIEISPTLHTISKVRTAGEVENASPPIIQDNEEIVRKNLPKVIANKVKEMVPDGFELTELAFTGEISGKPFGVGVSGSVTATFTKKP